METGNSPGQEGKHLRGLAASVFKSLDTLSYVQAGFLLRAHLDDFVSGIFALLDLREGLTLEQLKKLETAKNVDTVLNGLKPTARRLCELSRECAFAADPNRLPSEVRNAIDELFRFARDHIPLSKDEQLSAYRQNIGDRNLQPHPALQLQELAPAKSD